MALNPQQLAQMQGIFDENNKRKKIQDIPAYYGNGKDSITGRQFISKIEAAAKVANPAWGDERTLIEMEHCLQGPALKWFKANEHTRPNFNVWRTVADAFLAAYDPEATNINAGATISQVYCKGDEKVIDFYSRVDEGFYTVYELLPSNVKELTNQHGTEWTTFSTDEDRTHAAAVVKARGKALLQYIQMSMFIHGLPDKLRKEVRRRQPETIIQALDYAHEAQIMELRNPNRVNPIAEDEAGDEDIDDEPEDEAHLNAINFFRKKRGLPLKPRPARWGAPPAGAYAGMSRKPPVDVSKVRCRYKPCSKLGHFQKDCQMRIRDKAPCLDREGKPYVSQSAKPKVNDVAEGEKLQVASAHLNGFRLV